MKWNLRLANWARTSVAVLQASARFQSIHLVIMGIGLTSVLLHIMKWLDVQMRLPTGILWPLLLWALYFGALNQQLADMATKRMVSCAGVHDLMSIACFFSFQQGTAL